MRRLRWLMIVLLLAGAGGLGHRLRAEWRQFRASNDPSAIKLRPTAPLTEPAAAPTPDYAVVAQQNPFHPERNDALPPPPPVAPAPTGPPPLVYGSMMLGKEHFALMATESDPKLRKVMEGDTFNGYKLAEVKAQSVVLEYGGSKNEVMLYNALSRLRREYRKTEAAAATPATATVAAATSASPVAEPPPLPPPVNGVKPPPGKKLTMTPFGPMWVDDKP